MTTTPNVQYRNALATIIQKHSLLRHPFYVAWSEGTLPVPALQLYASEYGNFIQAIATGWASAGEPEIAEIEKTHAEIWNRSFASPLGKPVGTPAVREVAELLRTASDLFGRRAPAIGALYAFEAQQSETVPTKLRGLETHYQHLPASCMDYFKVHLGDYNEIGVLEAALKALPSVDRETAMVACETMCEALYSALSGIYASV